MKREVCGWKELPKADQDAIVREILKRARKCGSGGKHYLSIYSDSAPPFEWHRTRKTEYSVLFGSKETAEAEAWVRSALSHDYPVMVKFKLTGWGVLPCYNQFEGGYSTRFSEEVDI